MPSFKRFPCAQASWLLLAAGLALALAAYLYATSTGLAGTSDSYYYLYAAATLQRKGQLLMPDGSPFRAWPPLFPLVLAALGGPGLVRWLNGVALLGAVAAWSAVGYQLLPRGRALLLPLLLGLGAPALVVGKFVWSEPLFNLLWASYFAALLGWLRRGGWALGLLATALGCLLPLQRLAGIFLLLGVGAGLPWRTARQLAHPSPWALLAHLAGTSVGILAWQLLKHPFSFTEIAKFLQPLPILASYAFVLWRWLLPLPLTGLTALPPAVWAGLLALLLGVLWPPATSHSSGPAATGSIGLSGSRMLFYSLLVSLALLVYSAMRNRIGADVYEAERYFSPLYPIVLVLALRRYPAAVGAGTTRIAMALLLAWVFYQGLRLAHNAQQLRHLPSLHV